MQTKPSLKAYGQVKFFGTFDGYNWWLTDSPTSIYGAIVATEYLSPVQLNQSSDELECLARFLGSNIRSGFPTSCRFMQSDYPNAFKAYQEYLAKLPEKEDNRTIFNYDHTNQENLETPKPKEKRIYVYRLWDVEGGYWIPDSPNNREKIRESDSDYFVDEEGYQELMQTIRRGGSTLDMPIEFFLR